MFESLTSFDAAAVMKVEEFLAFICVVTLCAATLTFVYRYISDNDDEEEGEFASTIFILTIAIGLLVSIIKSAPAISFGLFGAMSIVRFRAQIKRPQRMIFIFMAAAIGVCCGAGQYLTTVMGTLVLSALTVASFKLEPLKILSRAKPAGRAEVAAAAIATAKPNAAEAVADGMTWGVDFLPATLADGQRYRVLLIVDEASRDVLAAVPETSFSGARVAGELDRLLVDRGRLTRVISEAWPALSSKPLADWKKAMGVDWTWLDDVKDPPAVVACADALRESCLSGPSHATLLHVRSVLESWQTEHNLRGAPETPALFDRSGAHAAPRLAIKAPRKPAEPQQATGLVEPMAQRAKSSTGT